MADPKKRLDSNMAGSFFVDATCINCDTCRQLAPRNFEEIGEFSAVTSQPYGKEQVHQAYQALLACPVGSIGSEQSDRTALKRAMDSFPIELEGGVYYCGFNSEKSFGANSFFIEHPSGNWLIDSPRYIKHLVESFERKGGIARIFLTHRDDVADAAKYAAYFGAIRVIHSGDAESMPGAEQVIEGLDAVPLGEDGITIPVPGHTPGSMALLYKNRFLFTGDHLWWDAGKQKLDAPQRLVWRKHVLIASLRKLLDYPFEWVLAGHGERICLPADQMRAKLQVLVERQQAAVAAP